jgi:hypothetical protein
LLAIGNNVEARGDLIVDRCDDGILYHFFLVRITEFMQVLN